MLNGIVFESLGLNSWIVIFLNSHGVQISQIPDPVPVLRSAYHSDCAHHHGEWAVLRQSQQLLPSVPQGLRQHHW